MAEKEKYTQYPTKEKYSGTFNGKEIKFNRVWSTHRFTDEECEALLSGAEIEFVAKSKAGKDYTARGKLEEQEYNGIKFYGFKLNTEKTIPDAFNGHTFSDKEKKDLEKGKTIYCIDLFSTKSGKNYAAYLRFDKEKGMQMAFQNDEE